MGAPRLLAALAESAHADIRLAWILRLAPFQRVPVTQGGAAPPRPPPDIRCRCCGGRTPLLGCCCCCCGPRRADAGSKRTAQNGPPPSRGTPGEQHGVGRRGPGGYRRGRSLPGSRYLTQNCSRGRGRRTHHPRGAHDSGQGVGLTPGTARTELAYPFLGPRSRRFPGVGVADTSRPRVPKTWIRERATAVRQITISSHRSMHPPGRTRGGGSWWRAGR